MPPAVNGPAPTPAPAHINPDIGQPSTVALLTVNTPDGPRVVLQVMHVTGSTVIGMDADAARAFGEELVRRAREAKTGLLVVGDGAPPLT